MKDVDSFTAVDAAHNNTEAVLLNFEVKKDSDVPPYSQLRRAIIALRAEGTLVAGDRLPPMRSLAQSLGLAVNTVAKAYKELEAAGAIETRGRAGSFITALDSTGAKIQALTTRYVAGMRKLGIDDEEILLVCKHRLGLTDPDER
ncbi:GntR family transcriptional regulator [Rothia sp. LK2588]|uniref:GntR family transcriptional regulator n=1 Tax=Rothia sp. LK2588 TaxID=3114369 RepID=UPI0034CF81AA